MLRMFSLPMNVNFNNRDLTNILILVSLQAIFLLIIQLIPIKDESKLILSISLISSIIVASQVEIYRRNQKDNQNLYQNQVDTYKQVEALFSIFSSLKPQYPLPAMRDWSISPDFGKTIVSLIHERKPNIILEVGSGVSTIIAGYCLRALGKGLIISLEHESEFASSSREQIKKHNLEDIAKVVYAPLKPVNVKDHSWLWHDINTIENIEELKKIDMLIIDGPPWDIQPLARYPALPILFELLNDGAVILLDDCHRKDEQEIVVKWLEEFDCFESQFIETERGGFILSKK